jgi:hypothetical protein
LALITGRPLLYIIDKDGVNGVELLATVVPSQIILNPQIAIENEDT